jgi:hypothetical protein
MISRPLSFGRLQSYGYTPHYYNINLLRASGSQNTFFDLTFGCVIAVTDRP